MEEEEYFTEKCLSQFAVNYKKFPLLWCSWHPKYADQLDRNRAYRRLAVAQGVPGGAGVLRRMLRLCQHFHERVKREVARLAAAEGDPRAPPAPEWAVAAERYLCLKPFARQPAPDARLVRLARGMRRGARAGGGLGSRLAAQLAPGLGLSKANAVKLWRELRHAALAAAHEHILRGDAPGERAPSSLHWAVADLTVLYGREVIADEHYQKVETLQALLGTFHLVQQYGLEPAARNSAAAWRRAARIYSRKGAAASALLLQRRWFELREAARCRLAPGAGAASGAARALPLHRAVADRYPHVVSGAAVSWELLRRQGRLAPPTSATGPAPGETFCLGLEDNESDGSVSDKEETNDDVILIEREIETIDVDGDDSGGESPVGLKGPLEPAGDTGHGHDQPAVSQNVHKAEAPVEETVGVVKQVDRTVDSASDIQDNSDIKKDTNDTADVDKGADKTVGESEQTGTTAGVCALTIGSIIDQTVSAFSKTNLTDSGSSNIDPAMDTQNESHKNTDVSIEEGKRNKYNDKIIDESKEIIDLDKTHDHNVLEALQDLDADYIETLIMFESDEEDVKADPNDTQISDNGVTKKVNECSESSSSVGQVTKDSEFVNKVSGLSGPKSKTDQLKLPVNADVQDPSGNGKLEGVDEASDPGVYNEEDTKSATENEYFTECSEMTQICSKNVHSHKDQNLSKSRPSVICRKRRLSESSESDDGNLVIDDSADLGDNDQHQAEIDNEAEEVDVVGVSDDDTATSGTPNVMRYPLLVEMLKAKSDDLKRYKRFQEIKRKVKTEAKKLLKKRCAEMELDAIASKVVSESLAQPNSLIREYARNIVIELNDESRSDTEDDEPEIDKKLLMIPVVALRRLPAPPVGLPWAFVARASNRRLLRGCRACRVRLERCAGAGRAPPRVRLRDLEAVRRHNRGLATAQVAPISLPQGGALSSDEEDAALAHGSRRQRAERRARQLAPVDRADPPAAAGASVEADADAVESADEGPETGAGAGAGAARSCLHVERDYVSGCADCEARALARPPASRADAELQRRALRRTARLARLDQLIVDREKGKECKREAEHAPAPAPAPRAKSPYDEQRALRDWLREKSVVAEKFGIKPRSYKKLGGERAPPAPGPRTFVTMNKAGELSLNPPLLLNRAGSAPARAAAHYVVDPQGAVLSAARPARPARPAPRQHCAATLILNPVPKRHSSNNSNTQSVLTQTPSSGQTAVKLTPKFFNVNCVANINKTLNTLAAHEPPPEPAAGEGLLPIITHVESLALNHQTSPVTPLTMSGQTTITPIPTPKSQNVGQQGTTGITQCDVSFANSSQGNVMQSGGFLTAQTGYIIQRPQSEMQQQLPAVLHAQAAGGGGAPPGPYARPAAAPRPDAAQLPMLMTTQQAAAVQQGQILQRPASMLQVNSVQAGPPQTNSLVLAPQNTGQGQLTMTLLHQQLVKPTTLQVNFVQAGPAKSSSLSGAPQAASAPGSAGLGGAGTVRAPRPPAARDQASQRTLCFEKLQPSLPPVPAREWAVGRDPTALSVLAAGPGAAWRVARHLVLCEATAPRAADQYYALAPLRRLILPEDETKQKQKMRQQNKTKDSAINTEHKEREPSVSWLKVRSFAKLGNDAAQGDKSRDTAGGGGGGEDMDSAGDAEAVLRAPPRVFLENKVYVKIRESPLTYAKVLQDVSGPAACRALLLRREPVHLLSLRSGALTTVYGEPSADGSSITLTAAKELFGVLHELAAHLAPTSGPPRAPRPPRAPAPPARVVSAATPATPATPAATKRPARPDEPTTTIASKLIKYMSHKSTAVTGAKKNKSKKGKSIQVEKAGELSDEQWLDRYRAAPPPVIHLDSSDGED